jgi:IS30 family transposase
MAAAPACRAPAAGPARPDPRHGQHPCAPARGGRSRLAGHWEGDFIKGAGNKSSVGVLVERTSRLVLLAKMEDATAASALAGFSAKLNSIAAPMRKSFTYDQGKEMARHVELARQHRREGLLLRSAQPLAARHLREHQRAAPAVPAQGHRLSVYSQDELDAIADSLNNQAARYARHQHCARQRMP